LTGGASEKRNDFLAMTLPPALLIDEATDALHVA
jgi:hypothetical protein